MAARVWLLFPVVAGGGGWFLISRTLMGTDTGLAVNEAIGAALGVMVFVSVIGVIRQRRRSAGRIASQGDNLEDVTEPETESEPTRGLSRNVRIAATIVLAGLIAWFFFAWLGLDRNVFDAAGESIGSGLLLLLIVSVVGMALKRG